MKYNYPQMLWSELHIPHYISLSAGGQNQALQQNEIKPENKYYIPMK